ncbi:class A beta-lactamase [Epibacterium sp. Ofav1-8]|uniref:class A beta-lactamase n=1 Tax=Epibacterium sp. Ofav1-8 TaxID=2917735 RepID=UPI001EF5B6C7|nr:class A beta-lactamase [Epibacterium sp. Ofav1-8]MCG7625077.1 class A beta-lactamase [Epibacterium sp. Ofav1-8]
MRFTAASLSRLAAGLTFGIIIASAAPAETSIEALSDTVTQVENRLGARVGLSLVDTGSQQAWSYRADERFLMNSTVKTPICAAVLARVDAGEMALSDRLLVKEDDLLSYAPVTEGRVGAEMSLADLCFAALDMSDNTATNMVLDHLGGPQEVTAFFRSTGDEVSRLDRREPDLNTFAVDDPRDTTTPAAMSETLRTLLLGDALSEASRDQLAEWMRHGGVTGDLLRAAAPEGWQVFDKSGSGSHTRNIIAVVTPEGSEPWVVALFISDAEVDFATRNAALKEIGNAIMAVIRD